MNGFLRGNDGVLKTIKPEKWKLFGFSLCCLKKRMMKNKTRLYLKGLGRKTREYAEELMLGIPLFLIYYIITGYRYVKVWLYGKETEPYL